MIVSATVEPSAESPGSYAVTLATPAGDTIAVLTMPADAGAALAEALRERPAPRCCHLAGDGGRCPCDATHLVYDPADAVGTYFHACAAHVGPMTGQGEAVYRIDQYGESPPDPVGSALHRLTGLDTGAVEIRAPSVVDAPPGVA